MAATDLALELWPVAGILITFGLALFSISKSNNTANKLDTINKGLNQRIDFFEKLINKTMAESSKLTDDSIKSSTEMRQILFEIIKNGAKKDQVPETGDTEMAIGSATASVANFLGRFSGGEDIRTIFIMAFPESVIDQAWKRSGGKCECKRTSHGHASPHGKQLVKSNQGREGIGAWEAHHINANGGDVLSNCEILCWDCHKKTL